MNNFRTNKKTVSIFKCEANPWNPNKQSKEMFDKEVASIKELGLLGSILVREIGNIYQILDGEHRYKACLELGYTDITVESLGELPDQDAKLLTVLLNNLHGEDDIEKRAKIFEELNSGQLQLLPFSDQEIQNEKKLFKFDFSQYDEKLDDEKKKINIITVKTTDEGKKLWDDCFFRATQYKQSINEVVCRMAIWYLSQFPELDIPLEIQEYTNLENF